MLSLVSNIMSQIMSSITSNYIVVIEDCTTLQSSVVANVKVFARSNQRLLREQKVSEAQRELLLNDVSDSFILHHLILKDIKF